MSKDFKILRTIEFHETDAAGFVHFSRFFNYMEEAEHAFLQSLDIPVYEKEQSGWVGWPRVSASCNYHSPLQFQDNFEVGVQVIEIGNKTVRYGIRFMKIEKEGRTEAATGEITSIYGRKSSSGGGIHSLPIPENFLEKLR